MPRMFNIFPRVEFGTRLFQSCLALDDHNTGMRFRVILTRCYCRAQLVPFDVVFPFLVGIWSGTSEWPVLEPYIAEYKGCLPGILYCEIASRMVFTEYFARVNSPLYNQL